MNAPSQQRRFRFGLRGFLLLVVLIGVIAGLVGRQIDYRRRELALYPAVWKQYELTEAVLDAETGRARKEMAAVGTIGYGSSSAASGREWHINFDADLTPHDETGEFSIRLRFEGKLDGLEIQPILIYDQGAPDNPRFIEALTREYDKHKWSYRVVRETASQSE